MATLTPGIPTYSVHPTQYCLGWKMFPGRSDETVCMVEVLRQSSVPPPIGLTRCHFFGVLVPHAHNPSIGESHHHRCQLQVFSPPAPIMMDAWDVTIRTQHLLLSAEPANIFYEGLDSKYFQYCGLCKLSCNSPTVPGCTEAAVDTEMNGHGCFPWKLYLWTLKFEFHIIFTHHKILFSI